MTNHELNHREAQKEIDHYSGMREIKFGLSPNVFICGGAGAVLGAILAYWGTSDLGIIGATTICFAILSGIFGMFV